MMIDDDKDDDHYHEDNDDHHDHDGDDTDNDDDDNDGHDDDNDYSNIFYDGSNLNIKDIKIYISVQTDCKHALPCCIFNLTTILAIHT